MNKLFFTDTFIRQTVDSDVREFTFDILEDELDRRVDNAIGGQIWEIIECLLEDPIWDNARLPIVPALKKELTNG